MRGEEGTLLIYCISYQLYIYYSAVRTDHVWSCLAATHRLSITWSTDHGARVSGRLLQYPVTTVRLSGSLKALPVYWCRGWRLGLRRLMDLVLVGASRPFNTLFHFGEPVALRGTSPDFGPLSGTFCWWVISFAHFSHLDQLFHFLKKKNCFTDVSYPHALPLGCAQTRWISKPIFLHHTDCTHTSGLSSHQWQVRFAKGSRNRGRRRGIKGIGT